MSISASNDQWAATSLEIAARIDAAKGLPADVQDAVFDMFGTDDVYANASLWIWRVPDNGADMDAVRLRAIDMALAPTEHERLVDLDQTPPDLLDEAQHAVHLGVARRFCRSILR